MSLTPAQKRKIFERDDWWCQVAHLMPVPCSGGLNVHHRFEVSDGGSDRPENCVSICRGHHDILHDMHPERRTSVKLIAKLTALGFICSEEPEHALGIVTRPHDQPPMPVQPPANAGELARKRRKPQPMGAPPVPKTPPPGYRPGLKDTRMSETDIDTIMAAIETLLEERGQAEWETIVRLLPFRADVLDISYALTVLAERQRIQSWVLKGGEGPAVWRLAPEETEPEPEDVTTLLAAIAEHQLSLSALVRTAVRLLYVVLIILGFLAFYLVKGTVVL